MTKVLIGSIAGPAGTDGATGPQGLPGTGLAWVNVAADFEADPTGDTDSTTAIQNAINSLDSSGGVVYFPTGTYGITPPSLTVPAITVPSNVTLTGDGRGASILRKDADGILIDFSGKGPLSQTTDVSVNQGLKDLLVDGNEKAGLILRFYYVQSYYEENVTLKNGTDVFVDMAQFWDSRMINGLYIGGGSASDSVISGAQACPHLFRNSAAPATTLSGSISGTITALPVTAIDVAMPAGVVQVWNAAGDLQNFTTAGATSGATSIPVTSAVVAHTFVSGDAVNGYGWTADNNNALTYLGCHWEDSLSGAFWITAGFDNTSTPNGIKFIGSKIEQDNIGYDAPIVQVDAGMSGLLIDGLDIYAGGFADGFSTPVVGMQLHTNFGSFGNINMSNGAAATISTGIDSGGNPNNFVNVFQYWATSPTVAGFNGQSDTENNLVNVEIKGTFTTDFAGTYTVVGESSGGTVTSVAVASANGFAGTVSDDTTDADITIKTTVSGILKGNGTAISAATSGTDYAPATTGSAILKASSGGFAAATAGTDYAAPTTGSAILKGNGAGGFSAATSGTDYAPATTGTAILKASSGGFAAATSGTDYAPATTGSSILKASSGGFAAATSGTDYAPATTGSGLLKGNGAGGFSVATSGTDYAPATTGTSLLKASSGGFAAATAGTDYVAPTGSGAALTGITASQVGAIALSLAAALGDTIAASASGAWAKLSGNTTTTKKFYTQTGTGSVSAAPGWNTIVAGDVPTLNQSTTGNAATATNLAGGATLPAYLAPKVTALTDGSSIATNAALGNDFSVTIAGNRTMAAPTNAVDGQKIMYAIKQDGTGSRTITWTTGTAGFSFGSGTAPTLSTTASDVDLVAFRYSSAAGGATGRWCYMGAGLGY
jgi:hypothetical protein